MQPAPAAILRDEQLRREGPIGIGDGGLARTDHGGDLPEGPHRGNPSIPSSSWTPSVLSAIETRLY